MLNHKLGNNSIVTIPALNIHFLEKADIFFYLHISSSYEYEWLHKS